MKSKSRGSSGLVRSGAKAPHTSGRKRPVAQEFFDGPVVCSQAVVGQGSLDVSAKNEGARRLYEHLGMTVESQWPKRLAIPGLKFYRMTKAL